MPELPEVEHVARGLREALVGRRLERVEIRRATLRSPIPRRRIEGEVGARVSAVARRGKWILVDLARGRRRADLAMASTLLIHLGMSGRVLVARSAGELDFERHEHWRLSFSPARGTGLLLLRGIDARRFGDLLHVRAVERARHKALRELGPEPLDEGFTAQCLAARAQRKRVALKSFLLDGRNVAGIGNIYASEACFSAGLRPERSVAELDAREWEALHGALRSTLERAINSGGTSLRDYVDTAGQQGRHLYELFVYGRKGEPCRKCGHAIRETRQAGRSTFTCTICQT